MANIISCDKYEQLSKDEQFFYDPDYRKYKIKKVRDYLECDLGYTHFVGWVEDRIPIGRPWRYIRDNSLVRQTAKLMQSSIIDSLESSNVLMSRALNKKDDWNA